MGREAAELVGALYDALAAGDEEALLSVLHPSFRGRYADGMPAGGGIAQGPCSARDHWWAIGAAFDVRAEVDELIASADGRLLAIGTYRGKCRADGHGVEARFMHLWATADERVSGLEQLTDTARW